MPTLPPPGTQTRLASITRLPLLLFSLPLALSGCTDRAAAISSLEPRSGIEGQVIWLFDGDSMVVRTDAGNKVEVRLYGIDSPEHGQAYGGKAKRRAIALAKNRQVRIVPVDHDRYGRLIAWVYLPGGKTLNEEMVKDGLAWWYRKYAPDEKKLKRLEEEAHASGRGLWKGNHPQPPWKFRQAKRKAGSSR